MGHSKMGGDLWSPSGVRSTPLQDAGQFRGRKGDLWSPACVRSTPQQDAGQFRGDVGATCGRPRACAARPYRTQGSSGET